MVNRILTPGITRDTILGCSAMINMNTVVVTAMEMQYSSKRWMQRCEP
jgi:hypothetical protein